jgi:hypothetical protein
MINREKTKVKYGYIPEDLAQNSESKVVWNCDKCNVERTYAYAYYLKKQNHAFDKHDGHELCQKCSHSHRIGHSSKLAETKYEAQPLPQEVNVEETIKIFGHDPKEMSPWSRGYVILNCSCCQKETETRRCSLNTNKSLQETGKYKCIGCWTKERRQGVKATDETKAKQKAAQQKRRNKEKVKELPSVYQPAYEPVAKVVNGNSSSSNGSSGKIINFPKKG